MKPIYMFCAGSLLILCQSCNFKSKHPQAALQAGEAATDITAQSALRFAELTDKNLGQYRKEYSLIYTTGDLTLYTERYNDQGKYVLYKAFTTNGNISTSLKSYYFKNDSLVLCKDQEKLRNGEEDLYKDIRTYIRNQVIFKVDSRTAASAAALATQPFLLAAPAESRYPEENFIRDVKSINDAINGTGKFSMVFDNITTYPDAHYITLKSKEFGHYKASIRVDQKTAFIDSLLQLPGLFRDQRLRLKWVIADQEAVYAPADEIKTSASGLNK